ncbi:hypothetical protein RFI_38682 [Reticulomyxa filosa]|uniref:Uncharacterized protein n=1 Tax=Reticulomyxa filosa TaxID=46433 RepID=X6LBR5_RETFI|nr:hypothetical protein RFI_38682 [Reticulomyxa filosa]|eukprot:ETN98805.1 hypothetical protein RFI_38682 [Reticulomyxa filosa]
MIYHKIIIITINVKFCKNATLFNVENEASSSSSSNLSSCIFFFEQMKKVFFFNVLRKQGKRKKQQERFFCLCKQNRFKIVNKIKFVFISIKKKHNSEKTQNGLFILKKKQLDLAKKKKEKYVLIKLSDDELVTFKPNSLSGSGQMADELSKEENWKLLQQVTKHGLNLTDISSFLFVKKATMIKSMTAMISCVFGTNLFKTNKRDTIHLRCEGNEGKRTTWCPKNSNEPRFYQELEKEDWEKHLQEFKSYASAL